MSSNTPASFASAAAGQSRGPRRDGRSANGTLTFRRPSAAVVNQQSQAASDTSAPALPSVTESQAAQQSLPPYDGSMRYSHVNNLLVEGWNTTQINGVARSWGKSSDGTVPQDPTVCWDATGGVTPMALQEMTEDEKEAFVDVNSTLKPQQPKDSSQIGGGGGNTVSAPNGRKTSISHGTGFSNNSSNNNTSNTTTSISSPRPTTRRREASDTNSLPTGGLTSPLANRTPREESSWFGRKTADAKEPQQLVQQTEVPEEVPGPVAARVLNTGTLNRSNMAGRDKRFGNARGESRLAHLIPKQDGADTTTPGTRTAGSGTSAIVTTSVGTATASGADPKDSWRARPRTDTDPSGEDGGQSNSASQNPESVDTPVKNARGDLGMSDLTIGSSLDEDVAGSPETNPFRSPPTDRNSGGPGSGDSAPMTGAVGAGAGVDHAAIFGSGRGGYPSANLDGNIAGWGNPLTSSTPDRDRAVFSTAFGSSLFSPGTGELQSPGFGGVVPGGGVFGAPGASGTGSLRTSTSKLGALFPASMQAQMSASQDQEGNAIGREAIGSQASQSAILASDSSPLPQHFESATRPNADTPLNAPRTMVMPDLIPPLVGAFPSYGRTLTAEEQNNLERRKQEEHERLKEFKQYREQFDATEAGNLAAESSLTTTSTHGKQQATAADVVDEVAAERRLQGDSGTFAVVGEASESLVSLSLTQQAGEVAGALKPDLPMPFPPPPGALSSTPLAAPTAQRTRSTLPDQYATSQSRSETPEGGAHGTTQQPPLAPWARDPGSENHRGPSLKEIQEAEAKKAAKAEEIAATARKVAAVQEAAIQREREKAVAALTPGLPTSSTWGNGTPAVSVAAPTSPWAKASNAKPSVASAGTGGVAYSAVDKKKTLADIQREEEARKQKTRELSSQPPLASSPFVASPIATSASPVAAATGWATVGAGAAKPPVVPASARSSSKQLPGAPGKAEGGVAMDEFNKWLHREVSRGLADDIDVNMFVDTLLQLPLDQSIISEAVYGNSKTMDGRHFAEEFIRRKKLAERGVVEKQAPASTDEAKIGGGWSEVAKKGGNTGASKEESMPAGFKVVSSRKKGKK
ncbi:hypothetical protein SPBR_01203 [Sporothrix brasiliensis 5110]|uniref:GYF domain-containing protein n=1 Tax=Sporothrix brasiliensis 5110 TaxID=1398154 RepID=A0A0C2IW18_9PEZI|nr:uncharacterized protein SPBR_01203 [Sporothrix brasiliensis 5110]KIH90990.1 hypothetical protein SPBR_01203 [Sporothrix brasiliensis 5110]